MRALPSSALHWQRLQTFALSLRFPLLLLAAAACPLCADPPRLVVDAVPDVYTPVPNDLQRLAGVLSVRIRANAEGYLEHVLPKAFPSKTTNLGIGYFLAAASESYEYSDDVNVKSAMDRAAKLLIHQQQAPDPQHADQSGSPAGRTSPASPGAALRGLLAYHRVAGDEEALAACRRIGDSLMGETPPNQNSAPENVGEYLGSMVDLYRATGDARYLDFCKRLARLRSSQPSTGDDYAAQYDFLLYLSGIADLYRITGDTSYLKTVSTGWDRIRSNSLTVSGAPIAVHSGSNSTDEAITDGCLTSAWMQVSLDLLRIRGDARYAQELEHSLFNQLLAFQDPRTGHIDPAMPSNGAKKPQLTFDRCSAATALAIAEIPEAVWGRYGNGIAIISYQPGHATIRLRRHATVQIYSEGDYPESGTVLLHVEPSHDVRFPLRLRVPTWASKFRVSVGNSRLDGKPGEYLVLDREWKPRDTVSISTDLDITQRRDARHPGEIALQRGPELLALSGKANSELSDPQAAGLETGSLSVKTVEGDPVRSYAVLGEYEDKPRTLILIPFSEAVDYRLWLKAPAANP